MRARFIQALFAFAFSLLGALAGCNGESAPRTAISPADASAAPIPGMAHGNHNPKYGGVVLMNGDLHFEIVAKDDGHYTVYFSDAARRELPATAVSNVKLSIHRPGFRGEPVDMKVSDNGEYWQGQGGNVDDKETTLQIFFDYQGETRTSDMPFFAAAQTLNTAK
ncbi:MAG: hypothetical protein JO307_12630 [Bryobacterales bacterium]|nr:hypothetical protein [Bryobacterales bacterium]MBV9399963.1 hypothetical protein [Bryobacterales bacterium]